MATKLDSSKDIYRGELMLFIGDEPIAFASSCGLDVSTEEIDISNKMMGDWAGSLPGKKSFTLSSESLLTRKEGAMSFDTLLSKQIAGEVLDFFWGALHLPIRIISVELSLRIQSKRTIRVK